MDGGKDRKRGTEKWEDRKG
jgi:hypothetical protein